MPTQTKAHDAIISAINRLLKDERLSTPEVLDAMENIRNHVDLWIDALQDDLNVND